MQRKIPVKLIVGLGNPGEAYAQTRHNIGFMALERLMADKIRIGNERHVHDSLMYEGQWLGQAITLQKPLTYMNLSGKAVSGAVRELQIEPAEVLVIYDDADLPLGRLRLRAKGSSGGHNGIESIINSLESSAFNRLRLGIGRQEEGRMRDFVLAAFESAEQELVQNVLDAAVEAVAIAIRRGILAAMNEINGLSLAESTENSQREDSEG